VGAGLEQRLFDHLPLTVGLLQPSSGCGVHAALSLEPDHRVDGCMKIGPSAAMRSLPS
jgi:hypothetical protein